MKIHKTNATILSTTDLSESAKEISLKLGEPIPFMAGGFFNVFMDVDGTKLRRAFSISSDEKDTENITFSIRNSLHEDGMTKMFWRDGIEGTTVDIMGPLGFNTSDKISQKRVFLFGFGIGVSVIKSLVYHLQNRHNIEEVVIMTGSRNETDILYKDFFDEITNQDKRFSVRYAITKPSTVNYQYTGYIQENIKDYDFDNADVYMCGQGVACSALKEKIESTNPQSCNFFVEDFH